MFCPSCGSEERQLSQYCRGCGMDLRVVRTGIEKSDLMMNSADAARAEIGRAIAERIKGLKTGKELRQVTEEVLPQLTKFLESDEDKRLRRMRAGVILSAIGLGVTLMFMMAALASGQDAHLIPAGAGLVAFLLGVGIMINGKLLTIPKKKISDGSNEMDVLDDSGNAAALPAGQRKELSAAATSPVSVIEHTTHRLSVEGIGIHDREAPIPTER